MVEQSKGHCKHGEFILAEGCARCIAERAGRPTTWLSESTESSKGRTTDFDSVNGGSIPPSVTNVESSNGRMLVSETSNEGSTPSSTALVKVNPEADAVVMAFYNEALRAKEYAEARVIATAEDLTPATNDLTLISKLKKAMEEKRKEYVKPLQDHVKSINDAFKTLMEPIEAADSITRGKILAFQLKQKLIREEQERINAGRIALAEAEMRLKGELTESVNLVEVIPEVQKRTQTELGTTSTFKVRKYRVVNFAELPDQYKIENSALLNKVVKAGIPSILGVEIYFEDALRVTAK